LPPIAIKREFWHWSSTLNLLFSIYRGGLKNFKDKTFCRLLILLSPDGLFTGGPTFDLCRCYGWKFVIVLKENDLPSGNEEFEALPLLQPQNHLVWRTGKETQIEQAFPLLETWRNARMSRADWIAATEKRFHLRFDSSRGPCKLQPLSSPPLKTQHSLTVPPKDYRLPVPCILSASNRVAPSSGPPLFPLTLRCSAASVRFDKSVGSF